MLNRREKVFKITQYANWEIYTLPIKSYFTCTMPMFLSCKYPCIYFSSAAYMHAYHIFHQIIFTIPANNMNPDQTAPMEQSDLGPYSLQYKLQI